MYLNILVDHKSEVEFDELFSFYYGAVAGIPAVSKNHVQELNRKIFAQLDEMAKTVYGEAYDDVVTQCQLEVDNFNRGLN